MNINAFTLILTLDNKVVISECKLDLSLQFQEEFNVMLKLLFCFYLLEQAILILLTTFVLSYCISTQSSAQIITFEAIKL